MDFRLLMMLSFALLILGCQSSEQEVIVVPEDFSGFVLIIFNQQNAVPVDYQGEKRIYSIPSSGILKTQFKGNYGYSGFAEFYSGDIIPANRLQSYISIDEIPDGQRVGLIGPNGTVKKSAGTDERIEFVQFFIGTKNEIFNAQSDIEKLDIVALSEK